MDSFFHPFCNNIWKMTGRRGNKNAAKVQSIYVEKVKPYWITHLNSGEHRVKGYLQLWFAGPLLLFSAECLVLFSHLCHGSRDVKERKVLSLSFPISFLLQPDGHQFGPKDSDVWCARICSFHCQWSTEENRMSPISLLLLPPPQLREIGGGGGMSGLTWKDCGWRAGGNSCNKNNPSFTVQFIRVGSFLSNWFQGEKRSSCDH